MNSLACLSVLALALTNSPAAAESVGYRITGTLRKDASSDPIFGARAETVRFDLRFEADESAILRVPAGTTTNLPNFASVRFAEDGYQLPRTAIHSFSFAVTSGTAAFSIADVIGDPSSPGAIFVTGTLREPTSIHILLANLRSGYFEVGVPECALTCQLKGGLVLDQAGPFGTISDTRIELVQERAPPAH